MPEPTKRRLKDEPTIPVLADPFAEQPARPASTREIPTVVVDQANVKRPSRKAWWQKEAEEYERRCLPGPPVPKDPT